jgi:Fungalysin metallopeptidase (M36)
LYQPPIYRLPVVLNVTSNLLSCTPTLRQEAVRADRTQDVVARRIREVLATGALCAAVLAAAPGAAQALTSAQDPAKPDFDAREGSTATIPQATADARATLAKALGPQATVGADPVTGGLRTVGRTDGFLTDPSHADPESIALGYVRANAAAFGLEGSDIATLKLASSSVSPQDGVTHLVFAQLDHGVGAYDSALFANVAADGRLINAGGAPVHDLAPPGTSPPLGPGAARSAAQRDLGLTPDGDPGTTVGSDAARTTSFPGGDRARLVTLADPDGDHLAWNLTVAGSDAYTYEVLVDAATGAVLTRHSLTDALVPSADANVVQRHPGDGTLDDANIGPWLTDTTHGLKGPNVHAYPDRFFPDGLSPGDGDGEVGPSSGTDFLFTLTTDGDAVGDGLRSGQTCPPAPNGCTWDGSNTGGAWATANVPEAATQAFYYTNKYHDWLAQPPIGFNDASASFDSTGATADPLNVEVDDYSQINNSNFTTTPDGVSPTMQLGLYKGPSFPAVNSADDATVVYHEYTHGLTNRLVGNDGRANGLIARQSQAMGEGFSDWYALDFLTDSRQLTDDVNTPGDELVGPYVSGNTTTGIRDNAVDCHVADSGPHCPGSTTAGAGGFTFGDLGKVANYDADHPYFEVHSDGEIWSETLWDLRQRLNDPTALALVTGALRLVPKQPSFLDMRDAILREALLQPGGAALQRSVWAIFAARGMGYGARVSSANATHATEAFDTPPAAAPGAPSVASLSLEQDTALTIPIANPGSADLTGVHATLAAASAGVTVTQGSADLGTLRAGASANAAFGVKVSATLGCGAVAAATLTISTNGGTPQSFPVSLPVGAGRSGAFTQAVPAPGTIPANYTASLRDLTSSQTVTTPGRIGTLRVTLAATHSFVGDLHATLTHTYVNGSGTTVRTTADLMERPGVDAASFFSRANLDASAPLIFADSGAANIQDILNTEMVVSGVWQPNEPLRRFAGEPRTGTWTLHVSDFGSTGSNPRTPATVSSWSLETDDPACAITDAPTGLDQDDATFHARLDPGSASGTTVAFELGATTAYGARSPQQALAAGGGLQDLTVSTGGLIAGATYHVRAIVLRGGAVVAAGADRTFVANSQPLPHDSRDGGSGRDDDPGDPGGGTTTTTTPAPGGSGNNDAQSQQSFKVPKATMRSLVRSVQLDSRGRMVLTLRATPGRAKGSVRLLSGRTALGSGTFTVPSNGRVKITIKATKKLLALVKRHKAGVKARVTLRIGVTPFTATLTIKPYKTPAKARG